MKKILFITLEYPPQHGGVASYYAGFVEELTRQGHQVTVIAKGLLPRWFWPRWIIGYFTVRAVIKKTKPDILFVGQVLPLGTIAYLARKLVPYVVFCHGMDVLMTQNSRRRRWLFNKILGGAKQIVANSEFTKSEIVRISTIKKLTTVRFLIENKIVKKIVVVYPCPNPNIATEARPAEVEALRQRLGLSGKRVLLTLGRVVKRKGHDLVLRALPEILLHVPEAVYVVAGVGFDLSRLGRIVEELKLRSGVRFVGTVADVERPLYYALCDLFVMPSRQIGADVEGFGLSFLEAALLGKPSIGGHSGGIPEAILDGQTGALVDPQDASALTRVAVQLLRDDNLRQELGQNARARTLCEFTWARQMKKLEM